MDETMGGMRNDAPTDAREGARDAARGDDWTNARADAPMTDGDMRRSLAYLIGCLEKEVPEYAGTPVPDSAEQSFLLYRALCNVRMPHGETGHTLPERFYREQSRVLRAITAAKGIADPMALAAAPLDPRLALWQGDITALAADAIVNAANSGMMGCFAPLHMCIDNAIHTMAGVELREECYRIMKARGEGGALAEEPTGRALLTGGYNLPARHVIHTVGPIVFGELTDEHRRLLASCYRSVLDCAAGEGLGTVAFCCISTGVFRFPKREAARIAVDTVRAWLDGHAGSSVRRVVFDVFDDNDREIYRQALA